MRASHDLVRAAAGINNITSIAGVTMQSLIPLCAYGPDDHVMHPVRGADKRRSASAIAPNHAPIEDDGRRVGCGNAKSRESGAMRAKSNIRDLVDPISRRCLMEKVTAVSDL